MSKIRYRWGLKDFIISFILAILVVLVITSWDPQNELILVAVVLAILLAAVWFIIILVQLSKMESKASETRTRSTINNQDPTYVHVNVDSYDFDSDNSSITRESDLAATTGLQFDTRIQSSENQSKHSTTVILSALIEIVEKQKNAKCSICKLEFDSNDKVVQCPECRHFFHKEHIEDWLSEHSNCPICDSRLVSHGFRK